MSAPDEVRLQFHMQRQSLLREGRPALTLEASLPRLPGFPGLNAYYRRLYQRLLRYCAASLLPALPPDSPALSLRLCSEAKLQTDALLSLCCDLRQEGEHSRTAARFSAVWSLTDGAFLPLEAFFPHRRRLLRRLREQLAGETEQRLRSGAYLYDPDSPQKARHLFQRDWFYAADQGLICFFPPLCLGSAAEGIPEFCLPWAEGGPCLPKK